MQPVGRRHGACAFLADARPVHGETLLPDIGVNPSEVVALRHVCQTIKFNTIQAVFSFNSFTLTDTKNNTEKVTILYRIKQFGFKKCMILYCYRFQESHCHLALKKWEKTHLWANPRLFSGLKRQCMPCSLQWWLVRFISLYANFY